MSKNKARTRRRPDSTADVEDQAHAPAGRGGAAMGRTVGLPFGGGRPRKRAGKSASSKSKKR